MLKASGGMETNVARGVCIPLNAEADSFVPGGQGVRYNQMKSTSQSMKGRPVDARSQIFQQGSPGLLIGTKYAQ